MEGKSGEEQKVLKNLYQANLRGQKFEIETEFGTIFQDSRGMYIVNKYKPTELPKIFVTAPTHPAAYELTTIALWSHGTKIRTHYDQTDGKGNYLFPPSIEAMVSVDVANPFEEPRIHLNLPGGYAPLESYRQEVVEGVHDQWIDPLTLKWTYTYSERIFNYNPSTNLNAGDRGLLLPNGVNQIGLVIKDLKRDLTSKGAQVTTWMPTADPGLESNRPCLQRIWFRVYEDEQGIGLNANWYFRSRDIEAWFMNGWANIDLVRHIGERLSEELNKPVIVKRVNDLSDSLHIYGHSQKKYGDYVKKMRTDESFKNRIVRSDRYETNMEQFVQDEINAERERLEKNPHYALNEDSQKNLAEKISKDPHAFERDRRFVREHFPEIAKKGHWWREHNHFMEKGIE